MMGGGGARLCVYVILNSLGVIIESDVCCPTVNLLRSRTNKVAAVAA